MKVASNGIKPHKQPIQTIKFNTDTLLNLADTMAR